MKKAMRFSSRSGIIALCLAAMVVCGCHLDEQDFIIPNQAVDPDTTVAPNLLCNPSFESDGHGSLQCWHLVKDFQTYPDTFSTTTPVGGGQFSLRLEGTRDADYDPYVETFLTNRSGTQTIHLSAEILAVYGGQTIELWLKHIRAGQVIDSIADAHFAFNDWMHFSLSRTLSLQAQDSLQVKMVQTTSQNSGCYVDAVMLTAD